MAKRTQLVTTALNRGSVTEIKPRNSRLRTRAALFYTPSIMHYKPITGQQAEQLALVYLQQAGCQLQQRNFRCRMGEIDLIVKHTVHGVSYLVFVEVRYRRSDNFGSPAATVTLAKQRKIMKTAQHYLQALPSSQDLSCRFNVVSLTLAAGQPHIRWLKNAFQLG